MRELTCVHEDQKTTREEEDRRRTRNIEGVLTLVVEFHPHLYQEDLLAFCSSHHIFLQAYSSLGTGELLSVEKVNELAKKYNKTSAQLLLRWAMQLNIGVLPKSCSPAHVISNHGCTDFDIVQDDMIAINQMNINKHYCWDPTKIK